MSKGLFREECKLIDHLEITRKLIAYKLRADRKASRLSLEANKQAKLAAANDEKILGRITDELYNSHIFVY
jgi:hypothetical protein